MKRGTYFSGPLALLLLTICTATSGVAQEVVSTILTDKIYQGSGTIDLMKNFTGSQLSSYIDSNGKLLLGVDVNEANAGNESSLSQGIAIKSVELLISTSAGTFTFSDLFTNTTAVLTQAGSTTAQSYYTLFGTGGSSQITGSTGGSTDISAFDDVLEIRNISVTGTILSASLKVQFVDTGTSKTANGTFFDFSNGPEDFALLSPADAQALEAKAAGLADAPTSLAYATTTVAPTYYTTPSATAVVPPAVVEPVAPLPTEPVAPPPTEPVAVAPAESTAPLAAAPGAPEPPLLLLIAGAGLVLVAAMRQRLVRCA